MSLALHELDTAQPQLVFGTHFMIRHGQLSITKSGLQRVFSRSSIKLDIIFTERNKLYHQGIPVPYLELIRDLFASLSH